MIDEEHQLETTQDPSGDLSGSSESAGPPEESHLNGEEGVSPQPMVDEGAEVAVGDAPSVASVVEGGTGGQTGASQQAALAEMENENRALKAQLEERTGQCVRIAADFDNYRKRMQREREDQELQIKCSTINELLPVVDNFERARSQIKPQTDQETTIHKSYQSVYKQLVECLKRIGVAPMRSEGKEFDPNLHEAVMRQPTDEYPEGTVMEELQRGYMLGDRVLRHALVKVAAAPEPVITSEEADQSG